MKQLQQFPLLLNGDICKQEDITLLSSIRPNVKGVMIGRASGVHLGLFNPLGGDYLFSKEQLYTTMLDFIVRAQKEQLTFKKIKFVLFQMIRYQKDYPYGKWRSIDKHSEEMRKKINLKLTQINTQLSQLKSIENIIQFLAVEPPSKEAFCKGNTDNDHVEQILSEKEIHFEEK